MTYDEIVRRLEAIEEDFAQRQDEWEQVSAARLRIKRDWELLWAKTYARTDQSLKVAERQAACLLAIAASGNPLYDERAEAEGKWAGLKAALDVLGERARILQSNLRAMTREAGPQPQWTRNAA